MYSLLLGIGLTGVRAPSQSPERIGGGGAIPLAQAVKDANCDLHIAIVASHPDDRYVLPAAYLRFLRGCRVSIVLFTRGEGGQNSKGPEIGDALGKIRTEETEDGARRLGAKVWYLNRGDGGYCRTAEEALELWGRESTIEDLARLFRKIKPDIILTTHGPEERHGHDLGLLEVLPPAVELASNPTFITPSLPSIRLPHLYRGARETGIEEFVEKTILPMDVIDKSRGDTIRNIAYNALTRAHISQSPFKTIEDLFAPEIALAGISLRGRAALSLEQAFAEARTLFDELKPVMNTADRVALRQELESLSNLLSNRRKLVSTALSLRRQLKAIPRIAQSNLDRLVRSRLEAIERVILHGLNLQASIQLDHKLSAVPGEALPMIITVHNGPLTKVSDLELRAVRGGQVRSKAGIKLTHPELEANTTWRAPLDFLVASDLDVRKQTRRLYNSDRAQRPLGLAIRFRVKLSDTAQDDDPLEFLITPMVRAREPIELEINPQSLLILDGQESVAFSVRIRRNTRKPIDDRLRVNVSAGLRVVPVSRPIQMSNARVRDHLFELRVKTLPPSTTPLKVYLGNVTVRASVSRIAATVPTGLRVGMIRGADDTSYHLLRNMLSTGVDLVMLSEAELPTRDLSDLDTIVIGIRALRHHEAARASMTRLLDFAESGGRLLVFYHKDLEFNVKTSGFRAYPRGLSLTIGKGRVTHHDAPVKILQPSHILLNWPNQIRKSDWDGWAQERGLYFPTAYGDGFEELLSMADPGQEEERGSLLYSRVGQGEYIYCALSLYRQLKRRPHPGACRLFVNLISRKRPRNR